MLLELCPPTGTTSFRLVLAFADLTHGLPNPPSWTNQLSGLLQQELDLPRTMHMLDRAVGIGALLDTVRVSILQDDDDEGALGVRVHCRLVDGRTVEWCIHPGQERLQVLDEQQEEEKRRLGRVLENILRDIEGMREQDEKCKLAVQFEEQQKELRFQQQQLQHRRHATTSAVPVFEPPSAGRKQHKRQKSFLHSIVSAVGSIITNSNRSSSSTSSSNSSSRPILPTTNTPDYPFPRTPSPSSPSPSPSPPLSLSSSCAPQHGHVAPASYYYTPPNSPNYSYANYNNYNNTAHHPLVPWSPTSSTFPSSPSPSLPSFPSSPDSANFLVPPSPIPFPKPGSSAHHQALLRFHRERVRTGLVDMYRRFVVGVLVFGFAEEVGLVSSSSSGRGRRQLQGYGEEDGQEYEEEDSEATETMVSSSSTITHDQPRPTAPRSKSTVIRPYVSTLASPSPSSNNIHTHMNTSTSNNSNTSTRSSIISPLTFDYRLWVIRSMLRRAESEVKEVVESVEREVREELERELAIQRELEIEVQRELEREREERERERELERERREKEKEQGRKERERRVSAPKSPTSPGSLSSRFGGGKRKVSFESGMSTSKSPTKSKNTSSLSLSTPGSPTSGTPNATDLPTLGSLGAPGGTLTKKKSKGKLVKKRSMSLLVGGSSSSTGSEGGGLSLLSRKKSSASLKEGKAAAKSDASSSSKDVKETRETKEKEKEKGFQRLIGSWGRGNSSPKTSSSAAASSGTSTPKPPPISILPPPPEDKEQIFSPTTMDVPQSFSEDEDDIDDDGEVGGGPQSQYGHQSSDGGMEVSFIVHPPLPEDEVNDDDDLNALSACGGSTESSTSTSTSGSSTNTAVSYSGTTETRLTTPTPGSELSSRCGSALDGASSESLEGEGQLEEEEEDGEQTVIVAITTSAEDDVVGVVIGGGVEEQQPEQHVLAPESQSPERQEQQGLGQGQGQAEESEDNNEDAESFQDVSPTDDGPDKAAAASPRAPPAAEAEAEVGGVGGVTIPKDLVVPRVKVFVKPADTATASSAEEEDDDSTATVPPVPPPKDDFVRVFSRSSERLDRFPSDSGFDSDIPSAVPFSTSTSSAIVDNTLVDTGDADADEQDQLNLNINTNLTIRLNLHPSYTRLTHLVTRLRSMLDAAERERTELRDEEERRLTEVEVRSRRRAWSNGALGRSTSSKSRSKSSSSKSKSNSKSSTSSSSPLRISISSTEYESTGVNWNNTVTLLALSIPATSSPLAWGTSWTAEDGEREGWVYVVPAHPHPLFHSPYLRGFGGVSSSSMKEFPRVGVPSGPGSGSGNGGSGSGVMSEEGMVVVRKSVDTMKHTMRRRVITTTATAGGVSAFGERVVDDRDFDEFDGDDGGVYSAANASIAGGGPEDPCAMEFRLDASWNSEATLSDDEDDGELEELGLDDDDDRMFRAQYTSPPTSTALGRPGFSASTKMPRKRKSSTALVTTTARSVFDDPDSDEEDAEQLGQLEFAHHYGGGDDDLSNIPPRPHMRPTKNHPPPARLFVVAEEDDDDVEDQDEQVGMGTMGMKSATSVVSLATTTDGETETEGEGTTGDEFEFDRVGSGVSKGLSQTKEKAGDNAGGVESEDDDGDENFFAEIHDITDIVGDIEDGFGRRGYAYGPGRRQQRSLHPSSWRSQHAPSGESEPSVDTESGGGYPYDSFDVDVEMGFGAGEELPGASSAEEAELQLAEDVDSRGKRRKSQRKNKSRSKDGSQSKEKKESKESKKERRRQTVKTRPKTPYPSDGELDEDEKDRAEDGGDVEYIEFAASPISSSSSQGPVKRTRNHKRQWQTMLGSSHVPADEASNGIEIKLDVEKPKPRFMPSMKKAIMGGGEKAGSKSSQPRTTNPSTTTTPPADSMVLYHNGKPRARTNSMYHRQPSPHSKDASVHVGHEDEEDEERTEDVGDVLQRERTPAAQSPATPAGLGLPLGIGFGYGSYSTAPATKSPPSSDSGSQLSEASLLCQPVRFASTSSPSKPDAHSTRLQTKSLVASPPPVFTAPHEPPSRPRKHIRSVHHLDLDLEAGESVDGVYALASSNLSPTSSSDCCSSASLPMSPSSPSPSSNASVPASPVISQARRGMDLERDGEPGAWSVGPVQFTVGTWESAPSLSSSSSSATLVDGGEEFTLAMDVKPHHRSPQQANNGGKKYFHLPSSLALSLSDDEAENAESISTTVVVEKKMKTSRKSVLTDPAFFEPPSGVTEQIEQLGLCRA